MSILDDLQGRSTEQILDMIAATAAHLSRFAMSSHLDELTKEYTNLGIDPAIAKVARDANFSMVFDLHQQLQTMINVAHARMKEADKGASTP